MQKKDIKVLVVEDDATQGAALEAAMRRHGYQTRWVRDGDKAKAEFKVTDFNMVIADCMLPKINGIDLVVELRKMAGDEFHVIFLSGVFKDRQFAKDALRKTKAKYFLTKPFDLEKLLGLVDECFSGVLEVEKPPLHQLLLKKSVDNADIRSALSKEESLHGFDLPLVYSLLSAGRLTGELTIEYVDSEVAKVAFKKGQIHQVRIKDAESFFGVLLVEKGYTTQEEVEEGLSRPSDKKIGERLVEVNSLSPHAINVIQSEQMMIRISKTIKNTSVKAVFNEKDVVDSPSHISHMQFTPLLSDWILSKLSFDWLKSQYLMWGEHPLQQGQFHMRLEGIKALPILKGFDAFSELIVSGKPLEQILSSIGAPKEERFLKGLHFLILERVYCFAPRQAAAVDYSGRLARLKKIQADMKDQNHFQVLGVSEYANSQEVGRAFHELAKVLHPDKVDLHAPEEVKKMAQLVFSRITEAHDILSNSQKREEYKKSRVQGDAEEALLAENYFDRAKGYLRAGQYEQALDLLDRVTKMKTQRPDLMIYFSWAKLKRGVPTSGKTEFFQEIEDHLNQVPPEERHNATYFFVKGLFYRKQGNLNKAAVSYKNSLSLDPNFREAKREYSAMVKRAKEKKNESIFTGDVTAVVGKWFKRTKGS